MLGRARAHVPRVLSTALVVIALLCAISALVGSWRARTGPVREFVNAFIVPAPANLAYAVFLGVLAAAIARRKRVAYWVLFSYLLLGVVTGAVLVGLIFGGLREDLVDDTGSRVFHSAFQVAGAWVSTALSLLLLLGLIACRAEFYARVRRGSLRLAIAIFAGLVALFTAAGYLMVTAVPGTLRGLGDRLTYALEHVLGGAVQFDLTRRGSAPGWVNLLLGTFGAIALFAALYMLLRSQRALAVLAPADEVRIRGLLLRFGGEDSLGYFATRRDKAAIFAPSGKAAVTYRVLAGVSLASADPIGDRGAWPPAIQSWLDHARRHAWTPAVIGASEAGATAYAKAGLKVIEMGDEAILHPADFTLEGRDMRAVRQAVNRIRRAGHTARVRRHATLSADDMGAAIGYANQWRDTAGERGYSMALGRLGDPNDPACVLVEALDSTGTPVALLSFSPWGVDGLSLDLMRRDPQGDNGLMEFMIAALIAEAPRLGIARVSLNFAAFRAVFEDGARIGAGPVLRGTRNALLLMSRWVQMESLYRSNAKYRPHWVPRYLCFGERRDFPKVGLASMLAEGLIRFPGQALDPPLDHRQAVPLTAIGPIGPPEDAAPVVRRRHVDLMLNAESRQLLRTRSAVLQSLRASLVERAFVEAETPILQRIHGRSQLRITPELNLLRLAVGGVERVFELGRVFRTEGGPEFTMLAAYQAYGDYQTMRELTQQLIQSAATAAYGKPIAKRRNGSGFDEVDLSGDWPVLAVPEAIAAELGRPIDPAGELTQELYERVVVSRTANPTFYVDFPAEVAPLTRGHRATPGQAERWDLVAFGTVLGSGYTEPTDPVEQRRRLPERSRQDAGAEADEDCLTALADGLPPTGGLRLGVDRVMMLLTGRPLREVMPFPTGRSAGSLRS